MKADEIRLECLKLAARADREYAQVIATAEAYEEYVQGAPAESETSSAPRSRRPRHVKADNS